MYPTRPWLNYLWNDEVVASADQFGNGFAWTQSGTKRRDLESGTRNVYVFDADSKELYSATRNHGDLPFDSFQAIVGLGYHRIVSSYKGLEIAFTILVPTSGKRILYRIEARNVSKKRKDVTLFFVNEPRPALSWHDAYGEAHPNGKSIVYSHVGFRVSSDLGYLALSSSDIPSGFETSYKRLFGVYGSPESPRGGLGKGTLSCQGDEFESHYVGAFSFTLSLAPGEKKDIRLGLAAAESEDDAIKASSSALSEEAFQEEWDAVTLKERSSHARYQVHSADEVLNAQVNTWLKRQISLGKNWGRLYGKGFRDVLQDITSFASLDPEAAKKQLTHALAYQYEDGNPIRMFEPNFHYPYQDGASWIPMAVLSVVSETGDASFLEEEIPYLKGVSKDSYSLVDAYAEEPYESRVSGTVLDHVLRGMEYLTTSLGEHGLVLWGGGDWNDSINAAGLEGKGESVWLSLATLKALKETITLLRIAHDEENAARMQEKAKTLEGNILRHGLVDGHFIYGINDEGTVLGGQERIFLNPQSFAVLSGIGDQETRERAMDEIEERCSCAYGYMQCAPSMEQGDPHIGRASYFQKGLVENGSVYLHGVAFKMVADALLKRPEALYADYRKIRFDNPANPQNGMEPYAFSNMMMGPESKYRKGEAPMSWITGTAGWVYRALTEYLLGVRPTFEGLRVDPCLPKDFGRVSVTRLFRGRTYAIAYIPSKEKEGTYVNEKRVDVLPLDKEGDRIEVTVYYPCV